MKKVFILFAAAALYANLCFAQWTAQDSLKLKRLLESKDTLILNEEAVRSIRFNANPLPEKSPLDGHLLYDATIPYKPLSPDIDLKQGTGLTLAPYNSGTKFNYDPINRKIIDYEQEARIKEQTTLHTFGDKREMSDTRFMLMGGLSGSFKTDVNDILTKEFWNFRARKYSKRALLAIENYIQPDEEEGRYEYYHIDNDDFIFRITGTLEAEEEIQSQLDEYDELKKGLLYFKYTADGKGDFTFYLPNEEYLQGTFARTWQGYRLFYNDIELLISLSQKGDKYYQLKLDLTTNFQSLYSAHDVQKVWVVTTASKISSGSDKKKR